MDINELINNFIKIKPEGYEKDIRIFIEYLEKSRNAPIIEEVLQGIRTKTIIKSMEYYIETRELTSINTVKRYAYAIAEFFKYIVLEGYIDNKALYDEILLPTVAFGSYWGMVNEAIWKNKRIKEGDVLDIYNKKEVEELIKNCDDAIELFKDKHSTKKYYNKLIAVLCLKLISYTGTLYRELRKININFDYINNSIININGFDIHLPIKLSNQFKYYIKVRQEILNKNEKESDYLFVTFYGEQLAEQTSTISSFLATCTGRNDLNGLTKYAIRKMMINSVNDSIIIKFTGAGDKLLKQCIDDVNKKDSEINWNRYLDSKLLGIETYDLL